MVDRHVVRLVTEYLDQCAARNKPATLIGIFWHVDGNYKAVPSLEEVNKALTKRPATYVQRTPHGVVFESSGVERTVTADDMVQADRSYRQEFCAALNKITGGA